VKQAARPHVDPSDEEELPDDEDSSDESDDESESSEDVSMLGYGIDVFQPLTSGDAACVLVCLVTAVNAPPDTCSRSSSCSVSLALSSVFFFGTFIFLGFFFDMVDLLATAYCTDSTAVSESAVRLE
jgi:hypothetical protein